MTQGIVFLVVVAGFVLALSATPRWLPFLAPLTIGVIYYLAWRNELAAVHEGRGDPQPGLVRAVGIVATTFTLLVVIGGLAIRYRRRSRD